MKRALVRLALIAGLGLAALSAAAGGAKLATQHLGGGSSVHIVATQHLGGDTVATDTQHLGGGS